MIERKKEKKKKEKWEKKWKIKWEYSLGKERKKSWIP